MDTKQRDNGKAEFLRRRAVFTAVDYGQGCRSSNVEGFTSLTIPVIAISTQKQTPGEIRFLNFL